MLFQTGGLTETTLTEGNTIMQSIWGAVYLLAVLMIQKSRIGNYNGFRVMLPLLILVGWTIFSVLWSELPSLALRRGLALLGTTIVGYYFGIRYNRDSFVRLLAWSLGLSALISLVVAVAWPDYGLILEGRGLAVRGAFLTKNELGRMMVLTTLVWLVYTPRGAVDRLARYSVLLVALSLLFLSASQTGRVVLPAIVFMRLFLPSFRRSPNLILPVIVVFALGSAALVISVVSSLDGVVSFLGRDLTFTGRTFLWTTVWRAIQSQPWLGYGYGSFWLGWDGPSSLIWFYNPWGPPHAHNGLLDMWLNIGLLGVVFFLVSFAMSFIRSIRLVREGEERGRLFPALFLMYLVLYNITESSLLNHNSLAWILYTVVAIQVAPRKAVADHPPNGPALTVG